MAEAVYTARGETEAEVGECASGELLWTEMSERVGGREL